MADPILNLMVDAISSDDSEALEELLKSTDKAFEHLTTFIKIEIKSEIKSGDGELDGWRVVVVEQTLLHIAADKSRNECVRTILAQVDTETRKSLCNLQEKNGYGRIPLHTALDGGCRCKECSAKNLDCVTALLEGGSEVNSRDNDGDTPLVYATDYMMAECASLLLEKEADASLELVPRTHKNSKAGPPGHGVKVILYKYIAQKIPSALKVFLDIGISPSELDSAILNLNFKTLGIWVRGIPMDWAHILHSCSLDDSKQLSNERQEDPSLSVENRQIQNSCLESLKEHFCKSQIHLKATNPIYQLVMTILYTFFVLEAFDYVIPEDETAETAGNSSFEKLDTGGNGEDKKNQAWITTLTCFVCLWWVFMVLNELYEISLGLGIYLKVGLNYAWWILIICVGVSIPPGFGAEPQLWQLPLSAFAVFLAWGLTLVQTSRFPSPGIYIEMLGKVVMDFAIFLLTFSALLVGFALAFHVLFPEDQMFSNVATAFVPVILMMIGETNYEGLFEEVVEPDLDILGLEYTIPAHIIFIGFIFVITVVLMNLLLGLAVSDIQEIRKVATVLRVKRQIEQIQLFESLILGIGKFFPNSFSNYGMQYFSIMKILNNHDLKSPTSLRFCPTDPEDKILPKYLKEIFIYNDLDKPCINKPDNLRTDLVVDTSSKAEESAHTISNVGGKRLGRLEDKVNQIHQTLFKIQEQLAGQHS